MRFEQTGCDWSMCQNLNTWDLFWTNQVQMGEFRRKVSSGRKIAGVIRLMLGVCSFSVLGSCMSHYSCLFLCMVVR